MSRISGFWYCLSDVDCSRKGRLLVVGLFWYWVTGPSLSFLSSFAALLGVLFNSRTAEVVEFFTFTIIIGCFFILLFLICVYIGVDLGFS